ncbi:MAG: M23 family metallopeptidase [Dysgonomonas sp.]|nr:M23 family metallopeptidase [Dysgonomonas sp.]
MRIVITYLVFLLSLNSFSQEYRSPFDIPLFMSGNLGELRNNHFHSGIDIKTQGVTGKPLYNIADGYVSRISVAPGGYGLALYITHPSTGHTSVYGHMDGFNKNISEYVKDKQYEQESFRVNLLLQSNEIPLKRGELIGYAGNSGGSGGPHLHFEIRDTKSEKVLDPLVWYKHMITDTRSPEIRGIAAYPVPGRGVVNGMALPLRQSISLLKSGIYSAPKENITAWGMIGLGIKAYDRMDGANNIYGVKTIILSVDGKQVFKSTIDSYSFDQTRMLNTFTDFEDWRLNKSFFMRSYIEPGNTLPFYTSENDGYIDINEERTYKIAYELLDIYGNKTTYNFSIIGKKQEIPVPSGCSLVMVWNDDNRYISEPFSLIISKGNLYNNICFTLSQSKSAEYYSNIFTVNNTPVPLDKSGEVKIQMTSDPLANKKQYGIVRVNGSKQSWIGGTYKNGYIVASLRELGMKLAVSSDTVPPVITLVTAKQSKSKKQAKPAKQNEIKLRVTDNLSGIASFRGTVDGKFVLFEHDVKSPVYTYKFDPSRLKTGQTHQLIFTATDACGNTSEYRTEFEF